MEKCVQFVAVLLCLTVYSQAQTGTVTQSSMFASNVTVANSSVTPVIDANNTFKSSDNETSVTPSETSTTLASNTSFTDDYSNTTDAYDNSTEWSTPKPDYGNFTTDNGSLTTENSTEPSDTRTPDITTLAVATSTDVEIVTSVTSAPGTGGPTKDGTEGVEPTTDGMVTSACMPRSGFDGLSFLGGIILVVGIVVLIVIGYKWVQCRKTDHPYREF